jgi:hypothetical protein
MTMRLNLACTPGHIGVVREFTDEYWSKEFGWVKVDDTKDYEKKVNPFALVVAVGGPDTATDGTPITTDIEKGDIVAISMCGVNLPLKTHENEVLWVYVVPFAGVLAVKEWECDVCKWKTRREATVCLNCAGLLSSTGEPAAVQ